MSTPNFRPVRTEEQRAAIRTLAAYTATLKRMAGPTFAWRDENGKPVGGAQAGDQRCQDCKATNSVAGTCGGKKCYGNARNGYRVIVWERQDGLCATCGEAMALGEFDVSHFVGNGGAPSKNGGYVRFNVFGSHPWCNLLDAEEHGEVIPARCLARPEFLLHESPDRAECLEADARSVARQSRIMARYRVERKARIAALLAAE